MTDVTDELEGAAPEAAPEGAVQGAEQPEAAFSLPCIPITMPPGVNVEVITGDDGVKHVIVGPFALILDLQFGEEGSRALAQNLTGGLALATVLSPSDKAAGEAALRIVK